MVKAGALAPAFQRCFGAFRLDRCSDTDPADTHIFSLGQA